MSEEGYVCICRSTDGLCHGCGPSGRYTDSAIDTVVLTVGGDEPSAHVCDAPNFQFRAYDWECGKCGRIFRGDAFGLPVEIRGPVR